ncbi:AAA family ATPase [Clostridium sp. ZS6]|uniref:AAA family ATPase n=1 Tax=Clostridium sp. ZS6 TaxID=2949987 RepID=UPI00207980FB|nr:AAA family ATPase [Clostridium sp. ZS6]
MEVEVVGNKGEIKKIEYDEQKDKLTSEEVKTILIDSLTKYNINIKCEKISEEIENIYTVTFPQDNERKEIIVCVREMTPGGRSNLKNEQRIQPQSQQINYIYNCIEEGKVGVLLGVYKRDSETILVGWKAKYSNAATPTTGISKQIKLEPISEAMKFGFAQYNNKRGEYVCAFRPEFIYFYIKNSGWLHNAPIEELVDHDDNYNENNIEIDILNEILKYKFNRIVFGAPGTGKSHLLEKDRICFGDNYERVTFHPNYSYAQFVGTYKPVPAKDSEGKDSITYEYVPGPFMRVLVKSMRSVKNNSPEPYLLLIEEINRANVAAVFGDVFQLLDRESGVSEYEIETSGDMRNYLQKELGGQLSEYEKIKIPSNMYIWATMNSADQGVFPMDTAFKRRWDFEYIGINDNDAKIKDIKVALGKDKHYIKWNELRIKINDILSGQCHVNEDKLLGPYFLSSSIIESNDKNIVKDNEKFLKAFKSKVIMYLYEDAGRQHRTKIFEHCKDSSTYSAICQEFDEVGEAIFGGGLSLNIYEIPDEE